MAAKNLTRFVQLSNLIFSLCVIPVGNNTEQALSVGVFETFYFARNELKLFQ